MVAKLGYSHRRIWSIKIDPLKHHCIALAPLGVASGNACRCPCPPAYMLVTDAYNSLNHPQGKYTEDCCHESENHLLDLLLCWPSALRDSASDPWSFWGDRSLSPYIILPHMKFLLKVSPLPSKSILLSSPCSRAHAFHFQMSSDSPCLLLQS